MLGAPGDTVLVNRGRLRSAVIACPDGCGSVLTINLDKEAGPAWRLYRDRRGFSLYPSVWREGGCRSHFIIWRDHILWCDRFFEQNEEPDYLGILEADVLAELSRTEWRSSHQIADGLDEIPWEVSRILGALIRRGLVEGNGEPDNLLFRLAPPPPVLAASPIVRSSGRLAQFWRWLRGG